VGSNCTNHGKTLTLDNKSLSKEEWIGVVDYIGFSNVMFIDLFRFTSHSTFITRDVSAIKEYTVSRDAHTRFNLNNISNDKFLNRDSLSKSFSSSEYGNILFSSLRNEFLELLFLDIVVTSSNSDNDANCNVD